MKTFIFSTRKKKTRFGHDITNLVYRVKRNKPEYLGETKYNTGSMTGHDSQAMAWLIKNKHLPKKCSKEGRGNHINYRELNKSFKLIEI